MRPSPPAPLPEGEGRSDVLRGRPVGREGMGPGVSPFALGETRLARAVQRTSGHRQQEGLRAPLTLWERGRG